MRGPVGGREYRCQGRRGTCGGDKGEEEGGVRTGTETGCTEAASTGRSNTGKNGVRPAKDVVPVLLRKSECRGKFSRGREP